MKSSDAGTSERLPVQEGEMIVGSWLSDLAGMMKVADETIVITINSDGTMVFCQTIRGVLDSRNATWKKIGNHRYLIDFSADIWGAESTVMMKYNNEDDTITPLARPDPGALNPTWHRINQNTSEK